MTFRGGRRFGGLLVALLGLGLGALPAGEAGAGKKKSAGSPPPLFKTVAGPAVQTVEDDLIYFSVDVRPVCVTVQNLGDPIEIVFENLAMTEVASLQVPAGKGRSLCRTTGVNSVFLECAAGSVECSAAWRVDHMD